MKVSAVVITKNEQDMIGACLDSVVWADEVLVIDNGSTDKTAEVARKKGARVVKFGSDDFSAVRNFGMKEAKGDWIFYVDSDERVSMCYLNFEGGV
jgi:glycosyltransferase involved in cell wall biosynthesis